MRSIRLSVSFIWDKNSGKLSLIEVLKLISDQQEAQCFRHIHSSQFHSLSLLPGLVFVVDAGFLLQGSGCGRVVGLNPSRVVTFDTIHIRLTLSRVTF